MTAWADEDRRGRRDRGGGDRGWEGDRGRDRSVGCSVQIDRERLTELMRYVGANYCSGDRSAILLCPPPPLYTMVKGESCQHINFYGRSVGARFLLLFCVSPLLLPLSLPFSRTERMRQTRG